jgi:hypothetical protein
MKVWPIDPLVPRSLRLEVPEKLPQGWEGWVVSWRGGDLRGLGGANSWEFVVAIPRGLVIDMILPPDLRPRP